MRSVTALVAFFVMSHPAQAAQKPIALWPSGVPGAAASLGPEKDATTAKDRKPGGKAVLRITNVTEPTLTFYRASAGVHKHAAVLVFPGGGYSILAYDLEGTEVCDWLNSIGVNAILVKYRVPQPKDVAVYSQPLQDAQQAMAIVRSKSAEWELEPDKIGIIGFSAGAHLAALLSSQEERPAFTMLVYPAYLSKNDDGVVVAPELRPAKAPPTFIAQAEDDEKFIAGTMLYYRALREAGVPAEIHIYSQGGHGYGLRSTGDPITRWPQLAEVWLNSVLK